MEGSPGRGYGAQDWALNHYLHTTSACRNTVAYMTSILSWVCARIGMSRSE